MSRHRIIIDLELTDHGRQSLQQTLAALAEGMVRNATEDYGIQEYEDGIPKGDGGYDGPFVTAAWSDRPGPAPEELLAAVQWWRDSDPAHAEDVVAMTEDSQDAFLLSGFSIDEDQYMVWVDPTGHIRTLKGQWHTVHHGQ